MLTGIREGLDRADKLDVGTTNFDIQAYLRHAAGITRAGVHGEVTSRITDSISAYGSLSGGLLRMRGATSLEAVGMAGFRGTF